MLRKAISFLYPINIYKQPSANSKMLEVTWVDGKLLLDSENANYSFGSLQRVLRQGLSAIGFARIEKMQEILVLGVAGGSVIHTLIDEANFRGNITGVEIDPQVIDVARKFFSLDEIQNFEVVIDDAAEFVKTTTKRFNLIIIDIFNDQEMPGFLFEQPFIDNVTLLLEPGGFILFNTMPMDRSQQERNIKFVSNIDTKSFRVNALPRMETYNELIVIEKNR